MSKSSENRLIRQSTGFAILPVASALLLGLSLSACGSSSGGAASPSVVVTCAMQPSIDDKSCTYVVDSPECVQTGVLNLAAAPRYTAQLHLVNGAKPDKAYVSRPEADPRAAVISSAHVELRSTDGKKLPFPALPNPFDVPTSALVPAWSVSAASVDLIPDEYARFLREQIHSPDAIDEVVAVVTLQGETLHGDTISRGVWTWPIRLMYASPIVEDGLCTPYATECAGLGGLDGFASMCLCNDTGSNVPGCKL